MPHAGIFALLVGVAIGTAIYYYFNSEQLNTPHQYTAGDSHTNYDSNPSNNSSGYNQFRNQPRRRRRRDSNDTCTICFETTINCGQACVKLENCGHEFHSKCINEWMNQKKNCPVCRAPII